MIVCFQLFQPSSLTAYNSSSRRSTFLAVIQLALIDSDDDNDDNDDDDDDDCSMNEIESHT